MIQTNSRAIVFTAITLLVAVIAFSIPAQAAGGRSGGTGVDQVQVDQVQAAPDAGTG
jgi:hypothetical protein